MMWTGVLSAAVLRRTSCSKKGTSAPGCWKAFCAESARYSSILRCAAARRAGFAGGAEGRLVFFLAGFFFVAAGFDSTNLWIGVDVPQRTLAAISSDQHNYAKVVYPGQTIVGTLTGNVPLNGISDYNYYYFVATAGAHLSVTMQRVDTSVPWESASSLDPQIEVIAPDGFIYQNLQGFDDAPGSDLNASITAAILPQTGMYIIAAETTRGSGQYRLTFNLSAGVPAPAGSRAIALSGSGFTLPLNRTFTANAIRLDPRGYPIA